MSNNLHSNWNLPEVIRLGDFPSNSRSAFLMNIEVGEECETISKIHSLEVFPKKLKAGLNTVSLITSPISDNIFIFGEIYFKTETETKRVMCNGKSCSLPYGYHDNKVVFDFTSKIAESMTFTRLRDNKLIKGQNIAINNLLKKELNIFLDCLSNLQEVDVEPYVFILGDNDYIRDGSDFIFFGSKEGDNGSVKYADKTIKITLSDVSDTAQKIIIAYSLYDKDVDFSKIHLPEIKVIIDDAPYYSFPLSPGKAQTVIGLELYRSKNGWRLNAVGAEYNAPFSDLCADCGITVK